MIVRALALAFLLGLAIAGPASAQDQLVPRYRTGELRQGRVDLDSNVLRARYGGVAGERVSPDASPEEILRALDARSFGWSAPERDLALVSDRRQGPTRHLRFQQTVSGVPVLGREVQISLDAAGRPVFVINGFDADVATAPVDVSPRVAPAEALRAVQAEIGDGRIIEPELWLLPGAGAGAGAGDGASASLVWRFFAYPSDQAAEMEVLVDALSGTVVSAQDVTVRRRAGKTPTSAPIPKSEGSTRPEGAQIATVASADASGLAFDPDPLATSGAFYGGIFIDAADQDSPALTAQLKSVVLPGVSFESDGYFRLKGPFVEITGLTSAGTPVYDPPAEREPQFAYTRAQSGFEAANVYYHIDKSQKYVQELGFLDLQNRSLTVNPAGTTADNSGWQANANYLFFGTGRVDDGEDASVIWHEYGHALLEAGAPGIRLGSEGEAFHEGWADYWAASYQRYLVGEGRMARDDWRRLFRWDAGDGQVWDGRMVDTPGVYPEATQCDGGGSCLIYEDGLFWASSLMDVYDELGRYLTDRLALLSFGYLAYPVSFRDAGEAMVQADIDHYGGEHAEALVRVLGARGLVDATRFPPVASHRGLPDTESTGGERVLTLTALSVGSTIRDVIAVVQPGAGAAEISIPLTPQGGGLYGGEIPLPAEPGVVAYWVRVTDGLDRTILLPAGAPAERFSFYAGPDTQAPDILHDPIAVSSISAWPEIVRAEVRDGLGVASVRVDYQVNGDGGAGGGSFLLEGDGDVYEGAFDVPLLDLAPGSAIQYRVVATDLSAAHNESVDPAVGWHVFSVTVGELIRRIDGDDRADLLAASGDWERERPTVGTRTAASGDAVWGTSPGAAYPEGASLSTLELPALNLSGLDEAFLRFWHWFDVEQSASDASGVVRDGGNVKVSVDGGVSWSLLVPEGGYPATLASGRGNPLSSEPGFGPFSYGWTLSQASLPIEADVRIRFDFGTDNANSGSSRSFAGWYLDDISFVTLAPPDEGPPQVLLPPAAVTVLRPGEVATLSLGLVDDIGIARVTAQFALMGSAGSDAVEMRLSESPDDRRIWQGTLPAGRPLEAGDVITYRVTASDFAGNEITIPSSTDARIEVLVIQDTDLLSGARSSGDWRRTQAGYLLRAGEGALILPTIRLGSGARDYTFTLRHRHDFLLNGFGLAEASVDDGASWSLLVPEGGYDGNTGWVGDRRVTRVSTFDLAPFASQSLLIRLVGVAPDRLFADDEWEVTEATVRQATTDPVLNLSGNPALHANFPDPFSSGTNISFELSEAADVHLAVFDLLGRRLVVLVDGFRDAGTYTMWLDASGMSGGVYLLRFNSGAYTRTERMVLTR